MLNSRERVENWAAEEKQEDFGGNALCVLINGAHRFSYSKDGMDSWAAEEKKGNFEGKERCVVMGGAHQFSNLRDVMGSWSAKAGVLRKKVIGSYAA